MHGATMLLQAITTHRPEVLDQHLQTLAKLLQRQTKDHALKTTQQAQQTSSAATPPVDESMGLQTLKLTITLMSVRPLESTEQRKVAQLSMLALIERSADAELLLQVTEVVSGWLTAPFTAPNTLAYKDRATFILKMGCFEAVPSPELHAAYLRMVHKLHVDPLLRRPELLERIEPAFMFGLRSRNPELRTQFFELFHQAVGRSLPHRLQYIVSTQEWEPLSNTLWLRQALLCDCYVIAMRLLPLQYLLATAGVAAAATTTTTTTTTTTNYY